MLTILINEITNNIKSNNFKSYKLKLFSKLKKQNEAYENEIT